MASIQERLADARHALAAAGIAAEDAALDMEILARHALGWDRTALVTRGHEPPPAGFDERFQALLARRAAREPVAQIVGHREFWGLEFEVSRAVLVPRPETELIVEEALATARERGACHRIVDVGTGSGCLAVALAVEIPAARVIATDVSEAALTVARRNAARHQVGERIDFVRTDLLDGVPAGVDLIVSNPPYVPDADAASLPRDVREYEPPEALFGGADGLQVIRRLFGAAAKHLAADGRLIVEFGFGQEADVRTVAEAAGWHVRRVSRDLQGIPRVAVLSVRALPGSDPVQEVSVADCLFCKIVAGQIPGAIVYRDDRVVAFKDINPQAPMHVLVVPRRHIASLNDLSDEDDGIVGEMVRRAAALAKEQGHADRGYRTVFNCNADAGQTVFHIHLHVLGGRRFGWPPG